MGSFSSLRPWPQIQNCDLPTECQVVLEGKVQGDVLEVSSVKGEWVEAKKTTSTGMWAIFNAFSGAL